MNTQQKDSPFAVCLSFYSLKKKRIVSGVHAQKAVLMHHSLLARTAVGGNVFIHFSLTFLASKSLVFCAGSIFDKSMR